MKMKHKRLFISVINDIFDRHYSTDAKVEVLPSEGYLTENETADGSKEIEEQISDFLIKIEGEVYLLECQSYDDGSMAIRIAEYAVIVARQLIHGLSCDGRRYENFLNYKGIGKQ